MSCFLTRLTIAFPELLAKEGIYMHMGRRFRRGSSTVDVADLVTMLVVMAVVAALAWLIARYVKMREQRRSNCPQYLFHELCHAHQLDWSSRQLLQSLAKAHGLTDPARIFVEPHHFNIDKLGPALADCETRLAELRQRLFAESDSHGSAASS